jgi:hypothetical protein
MQLNEASASYSKMVRFASKNSERSCYAKKKLYAAVSFLLFERQRNFHLTYLSYFLKKKKKEISDSDVKSN